MNQKVIAIIGCGLCTMLSIAVLVSNFMGMIGFLGFSILLSYGSKEFTIASWAVLMFAFLLDGKTKILGCVAAALSSLSLLCYIAMCVKLGAPASLWAKTLVEYILLIVSMLLAVFVSFEKKVNSVEE